MLIAFDILGLIFGVLGAILVGNKIKWGFVSFTIGSVAHGLLGYYTDNYGLMTTCCIFIVIDIYYFNKWHKEDKLRDDKT